MNPRSAFLEIGDHVAPRVGSEIFWTINERLHITDDPKNAEYILCLGGDGSMLDCIRKYRSQINPATQEPMFAGLNYGHFGFLMNEPTVSVVQELSRGHIEVINANLLQAEMEFENGHQTTEFAVNDFYFRAPEGTAKLRVAIDGDIVRPRLVCDGIIACTAFGSTGYNASCNGPILTFGAQNQMILTAIAPSFPELWRSVPLEKPQVVMLEVLESERSPVNFYADGTRFEEVKRAAINISEQSVRFAFAKSQSIRQRQMRLQLFPERARK